MKKPAPSCPGRTSASKGRRSARVKSGSRKSVSANGGRLRIEYLPLSSLVRAPRNPKNHKLDEIEASLKRHGFVAPIIKNDTTGRLVAGHGRLDALLARQTRGQPPPARIQVHGGEWLVPVICGNAWASDQEAEAYLIADNQMTILGGWHEQELVTTLQALAVTDEGLLGTGFRPEDLDAMIADLADQQAAKDNDAAMLKKLRVTIPEPETVVQPGEVYKLCERHVLVIGDVMRDVAAWRQYLDDIDWLVVYPGPFAGISQAALTHRLLLIQPNVVIAGHLLDQVKRVHGDEAVVTWEMLS